MTQNTKKQSEIKVIAIGFLLILLIGIYFFGQTWWRNKKAGEAEYNALATEASLENYPTITPESLQKIIRTPEEKFTLIDIRSAAEYELSHIPNSLSYPDKSLLGVDLGSTQKVIIVGDDTNEGVNLAVAQFLEEQKIPYAFLQGGHAAWVALHEQVITTGDPNSFVDQSKVQYITPEELKKRFVEGEKFFVLDVQPKEKFEKKHLKEAVNIPLFELENRIKEVPTGKKIIVYGQTDTESFQAGITLFDLNVFSALVISGNNILAPESGLFTEARN